MAVSRSNNFDFLRLLFASLVIVSHSYPLSGIKSQEILRKLTNGQADFGGLAVNCFFIISGYLIYQSLNRSKTYKNFIWKRILRLYPGLIVMVVVTLIIVPFIYTGNEPLLKNTSYFTYLPRTLSLYNTQHTISGVFQNLPYDGIINGSLWTICYEFTMYLITSLLFFISRRYHLILIVLMVTISYILYIFFPEFLNNRLFSKIYLFSPNFYRLTCFFFAGAAMTFINFDKISKKYLIVFLAFIILILAVYLKIFSSLMYFILPVLVIFFGVISTPYISSIGEKIGDNSYGIYIYGWFVQQLLLSLFNLNTYELMVGSLLVAYIVGLMSWHFVEKKALAYKNIIS